ncbi:hypothetical protein [Methylobacter sp.]|uniref:NACHT domain-containing protein n=1 Tax=Methylobacter sp. TaxID=2051955 RepID=UPI0012012799|nr:hypothetical protein [Methylobacter sp.]TAK65289.1 MAG: hypothetical protein EPO18_00270 [Methylobacter sp.]
MRFVQCFPSGAIILAPSGLGKTTLSYALLQKAIQSRWALETNQLLFDVPLPDFAETGLTILEFMRQRIAAHHPGITDARLIDLLRDKGAILLCDGFDRLSAQKQRKVETELKNLQRDFTLLQLFVFSRGAIIPDLPLSALELKPLTFEQQREFLETFSIKSDLLSFSLHWMPNILRELCTHPLLLKRVLEYWQLEEKFPSRIEDLFRFWLDALLCTDARDGVNSINREAALILLAKATTKTPINKVRAVTLLREHGFSDATFDELLRCDAIQVSGSVIELQHEALADYLRVLDTVSFDEATIVQSLLNVPLEIDSFFPILLMALLPSRTLQRNLWKRLAHVGMPLYLNSLRYRADVSGEMVKAKPDDTAFQYLQDLIEGLEFPLNSFFPQLKAIVTEQLIGTKNSEIAVTGFVNPNPGQVTFAFHPAHATEERVIVGDPPEEFRFYYVNLELSEYRLDSGRLLGAKHLKKSLLKVLEDRALKGGEIWVAERLIGRLRYMAKKYNFPLDEKGSLDAVETLLKPYAGKIVFPDGFAKSPRFHINALLEDITFLKDHGQSMLDPWWFQLDWEKQATTSNSVIQKLLDEHFRRVQLTYKEIVENSFKSVFGEFGFYSALPVRWDLAVVNSEHGVSLYHQWLPVSSWNEIGADVEFSDSPPERFKLSGFSEIDNALVKLGRTKCHSYTIGGFGLMPSFDGYSLVGGFDGETTVVRAVCELISDDIERLFSALPSCD